MVDAWYVPLMFLIAFVGVQVFFYVAAREIFWPRGDDYVVRHANRKREEEPR